MPNKYDILPVKYELAPKKYDMVPANSYDNVPGQYDAVPGATPTLLYLPVGTYDQQTVRRDPMGVWWLLSKT